MTVFQVKGQSHRLSTLKGKEKDGKQIHHVPKKEDIKLITITPSNLHPFSKLFHG